MKSIEKLHKNKIISFFSNTYIIILTIFIVWMLFFDENSYLNHREFNEEIEELEQTIKFYKEEITKDKKIIESLQDSLQLERFARETYLLKKENEDIYIIQTDSTE